jgi:cytochrome c-type biogenesis protein CcmH/NrfG
MSNPVLTSSELLAAKPVGDRHRQPLALGDEARGRRDWRIAAQYYRQHLRRYPKHFAIWVQLGHALKEAGEHIEALKAYSEALRLKSNDADLLLNLGHLHKLMGLRENAIAYYRRSAQQDGNFDARQELEQLGALLIPSPEVGRSAIPHRSWFERLIDVGGKRAKKLGNQARDRAEWFAAAEHYRAHLHANPTNFAIWVQLGHALKESARPEEALVAYNEGLRLNAKDADLLLNLGHLYKVMGRRDDALTYYRRSAEVDGNANAIRELARVGAYVRT